MTKPNLLCIIGNKVHRYVNGVREKDACEIDFSVGVNNVKEDLEWFRLNGLTSDSVTNEKEPA